MEESGKKWYIEFQFIKDILQIRTQNMRFMEIFCKILMLFSLQAKSEDQLSHEKAWLEAENVWLVHR